MTDVDDLVTQVERLLEPGDIELAGLIVQSDFSRDDEIELHQATVDIGELIAEHAGVDEWYVYSGNDDTDFSSNQHQGLRLSDDEFVWECQHLLREDTFDLVYYYEAQVEQAQLVEAVSAAGYRVMGVDSPDR